MADEPPADPPPDPVPYWRGPNRRRPPGKAALASVGGFGLGMFFVGAAGFLIAFPMFAALEGAGSSGRAGLLAVSAGFAVVCLGCSIGVVVWLVRRPDLSRSDTFDASLRYLFLGLLIGAGVTALAEGLCYGNAGK